jgi:hypothetical protein
MNTREGWLAKQLDHYVRTLRTSSEDADAFLARCDDEELSDLCNTYKEARESAIKNGLMERFPKEETQWSLLKDWIREDCLVIFLLLFSAFSLLYAGQRVATLERKNLELQNKLEVQNNIEKQNRH